MTGAALLRALLLSGPAVAGDASALPTTPALEAVSAGDRAWWAGDRRAAAEAWRRAARAGEPAAEAMARLRLLRVSGNLGGVVHGPRLDRALRACGEDPWCRIAEADYHLLAPREVGARPALAVPAADAAMEALPGPALARRALALGAGADLAALAAHPRDGLGDALIDSAGRPPPDPGTWFLGVGVIGAPGLGVGGALRFVHPDVAFGGHRLAVEAGGTSRGSGWASVSGATAGRVHGVAAASAARLDQDVWSGDEATRVRVESLSTSVGPGLAEGPWRVRAGASARWDRVDDGRTLPGHGPWASLAWDRTRGAGADRRGTRAVLAGASTLPALGAGYAHAGVGVDLRAYAGLPWEGVLAGRLLGEAALLPDVPFHRLPAAGGAEVLRGAPAGRWRGAALVAADLEIRRAIAGPVEAALFADGAWVEGTGAHPGGGAGLRLRLPPRDLNVVRVDLAVSDAGWAVVGGWGDAF